MALLVHALTLLAALLHAGAGPAQPEPNCRTRLAGRQLTTTAAFADGYTAEAKWQVAWSRMRPGPQDSATVTLELAIDSLTEWNVRSKWRVTSQTPEPPSFRLQGTSDIGIVRQAGDAWCRLVATVRQGNASVASSLTRFGQTT